ncbi:polysialyltransferase family glycosyltransferase [Lachnoclostridium edouardi]|uniref:polysialyltransferase family glycosyltransferase n=1 Tax=Lachnoclostridium edouardi TaxID=1926283 RepID=UPI000C7D9CB2|nr:polysialyltransferase family glycosyltransferase [Lachnoclostridium edouardi]
MILYYAGTYYQLLCSILHRRKYYPNKPSILIVDVFIKNNTQYFKRILTNKLFDEVYALNYIAIRNNDEHLFLSQAEEEYKSNIPYDLKEFNEVYVAGAHLWFGIYLSLKNISFSMFEECSGILSNIDKLSENVKNSSIFQDNYAKKFGLYDGNSMLIKKVYCSLINQTISLDSNRYFDFNVLDELKSLSKNMLNQIISIFLNTNEFAVSMNSCLLLTQHFANLNIISWSQQKEIYSIIIDYFTDNNTQLIIKTHPADIMDYENIFENALIIRDSVPSELLPFLFKVLPNSIITVSSTAINLIGEFFNKKISFDFLYESNYKFTHSYYIALKITEDYINREFNFYAFGVHCITFENLLKYSDLSPRKVQYLSSGSDLLNIPDNSVIYIDDYELFDYSIDQINSKAILIFLHSKQDKRWMNSLLINSKNSLYPIKIQMEKASRITTLNTIYIYNQEGALKKMNNVEKLLPYQNARLFSEQYEGDALYIQILMGILEATEKRLLFYINREQELLKQLEERG